MRINNLTTGSLLLFGSGIALGIYLSHSPVAFVPSARAQDATLTEGPPQTSMREPTGTVSNPYLYYAGTEVPGKDQIRIVACGTEMPAARRGQAAACFLIELGNGDKFLFDIDSGSMRNVMALNIPADFLTRILTDWPHQLMSSRPGKL